MHPRLIQNQWYMNQGNYYVPVFLSYPGNVEDVYCRALGASQSAEIRVGVVISGWGQSRHTCCVARLAVGLVRVVRGLHSGPVKIRPTPSWRLERAMS